MRKYTPYTYDSEKQENSGSFGVGLFSYERAGDTNYFGININFSIGIGIGGEAGFKTGVKW